MTLVDTSAWVEYLRRTGSPAHRTVRRLLEDDALVHTTAVVVMELLAGARDGAHERSLRRLLARCEYVPVGGLASYEAAAQLYQSCRRAGEPVRALTDCLIGVVALEAGLPVLHEDRDFDILSRHTGLQAHRGAPDTP